MNRKRLLQNDSAVTVCRCIALPILIAVAAVSWVTMSLNRSIILSAGDLAQQSHRIAHMDVDEPNQQFASEADLETHLVTGNIISNLMIADAPVRCGCGF